MNAIEKNKLVINIIDDLRKAVLNKVDRMPENWDGHEIRQFISDYYSSHYIFGTALSGKRKKEYKNTILVDNLV